MKDAKDVVATARSTFNTGITKPYAYRVKQLKSLLKLIENNDKELADAIVKDTRKPKFEAVIYEVASLKNKIQEAIYYLDEWMKPTKPEKPLPFLLDQVFIQPEPYGVVLIIGAWNFPLLLLLDPLIGAIAAGNAAVLKPSEFAPTVAKLLEDLIPTFLDSDCYHVVNGGIPETTALLEQRFDYIFYTGNCRVGKIVHAAASKYLTPCTLELGGKSPVYIDGTANLDTAASRIMFGKVANAGQACIAPDYVMCTKEIEEKFIEACQKVLNGWFEGGFRNSPDYGRIIHDNSFNRLVGLMKGANIAYGGDSDPSDRYIEPTIIRDARPSDPIMQEEIFGPLLPIMHVKDATEAIKYINDHEKPLALYLFSTDKQMQEIFLENTTSGNFLVNDTMMHFACDTIPFGGVGNSGMGGYHGKYTFDLLSHWKGTVIRPLNKLGEMMNKVRYPPYLEKKLKFIINATKFKKPLGIKKYFPRLFYFSLGVIATLLTRWSCKYLELKEK